MQSGESIYNLIPQPVVAPERPPMHRSKYPGEVDPATFEFGDRVRKGTGTFGRNPETIKPKTDAFLKRTSPHVRNCPSELPKASRASPVVPKRGDPSIRGSPGRPRSTRYLPVIIQALTVAPRSQLAPIPDRSRLDDDQDEGQEAAPCAQAGRGAGDGPGER